MESYQGITLALLGNLDNLRCQRSETGEPYASFTGMCGPTHFGTRAEVIAEVTREHQEEVARLKEKIVSLQHELATIKAKIDD